MIIFIRLNNKIKTKIFNHKNIKYETSYDAFIFSFTGILQYVKNVNNR